MPEISEEPGVRPPTQPPSRGWGAVAFYIAFALLAASFWQSAVGDFSRRSIPYSDFKAHLAQGEVERCLVKDDVIEGRIVPKAELAAAVDDYTLVDAETTAEESSSAAFEFETVRVDDPQLVEALAAAGVEFAGSRPSPFANFLLVWMLPLGLLMLFWFVLMRGGGGAGQTAMSFGKSRAKLVADREVGVTFADVAGCDEAKNELQEIVEFLRDPDRFKALGARIPRGVLVVGPPGTGKTLIARAVAGEAGVPFFSLSGSDFVEMFVGVILLAATNRPDVLDPALLRPGRFDRQVVLDSPDAVGREAILRVHVQGKPLAADVDLGVAARSTPGFSGADLANAVNEAALLAALKGDHEISQATLEEAIEKVVAGPERSSHRLGENEKRRVAYHEVGHAIVAAHSKHADPVHKISIVPRGRAALGYTLQLPTGDRNLLSRSEIFDRLKGLLGGRAAEELIFGEVSTGSENDLEQATAIARQAICQYGMGESAGLMHCAHQVGDIFGDAGGGVQRDCGEATADAIDSEVKSILEQAYSDGKAILTQHRDQLERVAAALTESETIDQAEFQRLIAGGAPQPRQAFDS